MTLTVKHGKDVIFKGSLKEFEETHGCPAEREKVEAYCKTLGWKVTFKETKK